MLTGFAADWAEAAEMEKDKARAVNAALTTRLGRDAAISQVFIVLPHAMWSDDTSITRVKAWVTSFLQATKGFYLIVRLF